MSGDERDDFENLGTLPRADPFSLGAERPRGTFTIHVVSGADAGRTFTIDLRVPGRTLIGTSEICEIRLDDRELSRRHAAFEPLGGALRISDLGSTNGTYVDRVKVVVADLQGGELVRVGGTVLRVDDETDPRSRSVNGANDDRRDAGARRPSLPPLAAGSSFGRVIGASPEMRGLYPILERLAQSTVPVILEGETGTGKEAMAEALHEQGPRAAGPFIVFDCTAVPPNLVESELFGHEKGAFTGAATARRGVFEQAHGGTLLIDEIGDLDPALQPKLLRATERTEIRRVGGSAWIRADVRLLTATRRDLDREVEAGRFREDLFHRLAVTRIELPPLRNRRGDVALLAKHFWTTLGAYENALPPHVLRRWEAHEWPGNVRELRNAVAREIALGDLADSAPPSSSQPLPGLDAIGDLIASGLSFPRARDRLIATFTERYVAHLLAREGGNVPRAAAASGIGRRYFEKLRAKKLGG
jgi:DNA-binding NtrC family response regulator